MSEEKDTFPMREAANMKVQVDELRRDIERFEHSALLKVFFLQNMSHELRNPLTAICGFVGAITDLHAGAIEPETQLMVKRITEDSTSLLQTVNGLLASTREECMHRQQMEAEGKLADNEPPADASVDELCKALEQAQRNDMEHAQLLEDISHKVHTQLDHIVDFANRLVMGLKDTGFDEEVQEFLRLIKENSSLLLTLVDDIRDWGLMQSGEYRTRLTLLDPVAIGHTCLESIKHRVPKGVELRMNSDLPAGILVRSDSARLQQVLTNLLINATKYTSEGHITLSCHLDNDKQMLQFAVTDTGSGIDAANADIIFHRFEKLNSFKKGSGLGLHICRLIAQRLQGEIFLDTSYTGGARFVFNHPLRLTQ